MITEILRPEIEEMIQKAIDEGEESVITFGGLNKELEDLELHGKLSDIENLEVYYANKRVGSCKI